MGKAINFLDIVAVKKDYVFKLDDGVMHCKKGSQGRVVDVGNSSHGTYYAVEFFDTSELMTLFFSFREMNLNW